MYGYSIKKKGILTDNYYKQIGRYETTEPQGVLFMIMKNLLIMILIVTMN